MSRLICIWSHLACIGDVLWVLAHAMWATTWQNHQNECAPSEASDQPEHPPSLIRVFALRMKNHWVLSYPLSAQRRLWSDWADAQTDLCLRWAHAHFVGCVMSRLMYRRTEILTEAGGRHIRRIEYIKRYLFWVLVWQYQKSAFSR